MKNVFSHYSVGEYTYETERNCEEHGCDEEGICRCSTIVDAKFTEISLGNVVDLLYSQIKKQVRGSFLKYCIGRLLVIYKLYDPDNWELNTCGGYYGEEFDHASMCSSIWKKLEIDINTLVRLSSDKRIEFILEKEYGYLLDRCTQCNWAEKRVSPSDINFPNEIYHSKIDPASNFTVNFDEPIGIVLSDSGDQGKVVLVDGYHRCSVAKASGQEQVAVILGRKKKKA